MKRAALAVLVLITLTACLPLPLPPRTAPTPTADPNCLPVAASLVAAIQEGFNDGITAGTAAAHVATDREAVWFVAVELEGAGLEAGDVAVFATDRGPDDHKPGVIIGVGGFASQFTNWPKGADTAFRLSISEPGAREAERCLK